MTPEEWAEEIVGQPHTTLPVPAIAWRMLKFNIAAAIRAAVAEERERCAKLADQSAAEAAERGPMLGGSPMHPQEVMDRHIGEMVSKNIAAAIRGSDAPSPAKLNEKP